LPRPVRTPVVLLTGFEPFGGDTRNPSWLAVQALHGREIAGHRVVAACLPTAFGQSLTSLRALLQAHRPVLALSVGLAGGRTALSLERVAINVDDARIPDNLGAQPVDSPVVADGPAAYFSSLPIKAMLQALQHAGVPAEVSQTAGTFVCNHVFYGLMHALATQPELRDARGGFMHVPASGPDGLPLDDLVRGLQVAVRAALQHATDVRGVAAGALS
jgi:pyroglutamyl-peptidase